MSNLDISRSAPGDGSMGIREIMQFLPHRFPFLLVDGVESCIPGESIRGYKNVTRHDAGSCSNRSVSAMPTLLVIEALAQVAVLLAMKTLSLNPNHENLFFFAGIDDGTFHDHAQPGDKLYLEARVLRLMRGRGIGKFATRAYVAEKGVAGATMLAAMRQSPLETGS